MRSHLATLLIFLGTFHITSGACVSDCTGVADGNYQDCDSCTKYVSCSGGVITPDRLCPGGLLWDDNLKSCQSTSATCTEGGSACASTPCQNGGTCSEDTGGYTCACHIGYSGTNCEIPACNSNPCQNDGTCSDSQTGYTCSCHVGYSGTNCEIPACNSNPCQNGGTCSDATTGYTCSCHVGYSGTNCEIPACNSNPCQNGGTCSDSQSGYTCSCHIGYSGTNCEIPACNSNPCQNGGTCTDSQTGYTCSCHVGYSGTNCELAACNSNPCQNSGTCSDSQTGYTCSCHVGYSGTNCEIAACTSNPCQNDGTCSDAQSGYSCSCHAGYSGTNCEIPACNSNPCQNGGTCSGSQSGYTCSCLDNFSGTHCEIGPCNSNPCQNRGTCSQDLGGFTCACTEGFTGTHCETPVGPQTLITCQDDKVSIACLQAQYLKFHSGNYGRTSSTPCPGPGSDTTTSCHSDTLAKINTWCGGRQTCSFAASTYLLGQDGIDPCDNVYKYHEVVYECLDCPDGCAVCRSSTFCIEYCPQGCKSCTNSRSCTACFSGKYYLPWKNRCLDCDRHCANCTTGGCLACKSHYFLVGNECKECPHWCTTCRSTTVCDICNLGSYWNTTYQMCIWCSDFCSNCSSVVGCTACESGFVLDGQKCVDLHVRLTGDTEPWRGRVEVKTLSQTEWGSVCSKFTLNWDRWPWLFCKMLGYPRSVRVDNSIDLHFPTYDGPINLMNPNCPGKPSSYSFSRQCNHGDSCDHLVDAHITCAENLELVHGEFGSEGRAEMLVNKGQRGVICDHYPDINNWPSVYCKQLGYSGAMLAGRWVDYKGGFGYGGLFFKVFPDCTPDTAKTMLECNMRAGANPESCDVGNIMYIRCKRNPLDACSVIPWQAATASSVMPPGDLGTASATDALNMNGFWCPDEADPQPYLQVDFGSQQEFNGLRVYPGNIATEAPVRRFRLAVSRTGVDWSIIHRGPREEALETEFEGLAYHTDTRAWYWYIFGWQYARYLRLYPISVDNSLQCLRIKVSRCKDYEKSYTRCGPQKHPWRNTGLCVKDALCDPGWISYRGTCYKFTSIKRTHTEATYQCKQDHSTLVSIYSIAEQNFITKNMESIGAEVFWLGLEDHTRAFREWMDGSNVDYTNWAEARMADSSYYCVVLNTSNSYRWEDWDCSAPAAYVCHKVADCRDRLLTFESKAELTASSSMPGHGPAEAKMVGGGRAESRGWQPVNPYNQYFQIFWRSAHLVEGVIMQGRSYEDYVIYYTLEYSPDGQRFTAYRNGRVPMVFHGSANDTMRVSWLPMGVSTRTLRLRPLSWMSTSYTVWIEVIGCQGGAETPDASACRGIPCALGCRPVPNGARCVCNKEDVLGNNLHTCYPGTMESLDWEPAGLESGFVRMEQLTSNSEADSLHGAVRVRLNSTFAWCSKTKATVAKPYMQVDLEGPMPVLGLRVQHGGSGALPGALHISQYKVAYSMDMSAWFMVRASGHPFKRSLVFSGLEGSPLGYDTVTRLFPHSVMARGVRLYPTLLASDDFVCARMEVLLLPWTKSRSGQLSGLCGLGTTGCSHTCYDTIDSFTCVCPAGHHLLPDKRTCTRDAECNKYGMTTFGGTCYQVIRQDMSWEYAKGTCHFTGAHLLTIDTPQEWQFIRRSMRVIHKAWIGLHDPSWMFETWESTGEQVEMFESSLDNGKSDQEADYIKLNNEGNFFPERNIRQDGFICKWACNMPLLVSPVNNVETVGASSQNDSHPAATAFISGEPTTGWVPLSPESQHWEVMFKAMTTIAAVSIVNVATTNRGKLEKFQLQLRYRRWGDWFSYRDGFVVKEFEMTQPLGVVTTHPLSTAIDVFGVRFKPVSWQGSDYELRFEIWGCTARPHPDVISAHPVKGKIYHRKNPSFWIDWWQLGFAESVWIGLDGTYKLYGAAIKKYFTEGYPYHFQLSTHGQKWETLTTWKYTNYWPRNYSINFQTLFNAGWNKFRAENRAHNIAKTQVEIFGKRDFGGVREFVFDLCGGIHPCANVCTADPYRLGFMCSCSDGQILGQNLYSCLVDNVTYCPEFEYAGLRDADQFIQDSQVLASSELPNHEGRHGRLDGPKSWCSSITDTKPWLQVSFGREVKVMGVIVQQGLATPELTMINAERFSILHTRNLTHWDYIRIVNETVFEMPENATQVELRFPPVSALYVRLYVLIHATQVSYCLRAEVLLAPRQACLDQLTAGNCTENNSCIAGTCKALIGGYECDCPEGKHLTANRVACDPDIRCPKGEASIMGDCYGWYTQNATSFLEAHCLCEDLQGYLATFREPEQLYELARAMQADPNATRPHWIGLMEGGVWVDGSQVTFSKLAQPHFQQSDNRCVLLDPTQPDVWQLADCSQSHPFICKHSYFTRMTEVTFLPYCSLTTLAPVTLPEYAATPPPCPCHQYYNRITAACTDRPQEVTVTFKCLQNCGDKQNPELPVAYQVMPSCPGCDWKPVWRYSWWTHPDQCVEKSGMPCTAEDSTCMFVSSKLRHDSEEGCAINVQALDAYCPVFRVNGTQSLLFNHPPHLGSCSVSPSSGTALVTMFTMECHDFLDSDMPLMYEFQAFQDIGGKGTPLHRGPSPTPSPRYLPEGLEEAAFIITVAFTISDALGASTVHTYEVKVYPYVSSSGQTGTEESLGLMEDLVMGTTSGNKLDSLVEEGDTVGAVSLVATVATVLNKEQAAEEAEVLRRVELRKKMLETLTKVETGSSIQNIKVVAGALGTVTKNASEITPSLQGETSNKLLELSENLKKLKEDQTSVAEVSNAAQQVLEGSMNVLKSALITLDVKKRNATNTTSTVGLVAAGNETEEEAAQQAKAVGSKMGEVLENVATAILAQKLLGETPSYVQTDGVAMFLEKASQDKMFGEHVDLHVSSTAEDHQGKEGGHHTAQTAGIQLPKGDKNLEAQLSTATGGPTFLTLRVYVNEKNTYQWHPSSDNVTSPLIGVSLKDSNDQEVNVTNLQKPVVVELPITETLSDSEWLNINLTQERENSTILDIPVYQFMAPTSGQYAILMSTNFTAFHYLVLVTVGWRPDIRDIQEHTSLRVPAEEVNQVHDPVTGETTFLLQGENPVQQDLKAYLTIAPDWNDTAYQQYMQRDDREEIVSFRVKASSTNCLYWDVKQEAWSREGCHVAGLNLTSHTMACACNHLTTFSCGILVLPNALDIIEDSRLFLTFFDNPVVVCLVASVWAAYTIMMIWARRADKRDRLRSGITYLHDNHPMCNYSYLVTIITGWRKGAGTSANIAMCMAGTHGSSDTHWLFDPVKVRFEAGSEDNFMLNTKHSLGQVETLKIWHDGSGHSPTWFLSDVNVCDLQTGSVYHFMCNTWLALEKGAICQQFHCISEDSNKGHQFVNYGTNSLRDNHLWLGIFSRPPHSRFTRTQRISCLLCFLLLMMLTNIMFYGIPRDDPEDQLAIENLQISLSQIMIGLETSVIIIPIIAVVVSIFKLSQSKKRPGPPTEASDQYSDTTSSSGLSSSPSSFLGSFFSGSSSSGSSSSSWSGYISDASESDKNGPMAGLPWWCRYIGWIICMSTCVSASYFVMLYGLKYGYARSVAWLISILTAVLQHALINQPLSVLFFSFIFVYCTRKSRDSEAQNMNIKYDEDIMRQAAVNNFLHYRGVERNHPVYTPPTEAHISYMQDRLAKEAAVKARMWEIVRNLIFVILVLCASYGHQDKMTYHQFANVRELFLKGPDHNTMALDEVKLEKHMWEYLDTSFSDAMYSSNLYNRQLQLEPRLVADQASILIGAPRLRQIRQQPPVTCWRPVEYVHCRANTVIETGSFGKSWRPLQIDKDFQNITEEQDSFWQYKRGEELGMAPIPGDFAWYPGGGYVAELGINKAYTMYVLKTLQSEGWVDSKTAAVFLEFTVFNPATSLFSFTAIIFEFTPMGKVSTFHTIYTCRLFHYHNNMDFVAGACEVLIVLLLPIMIYKQGRRMRRQQMAYFRNFWNLNQISIVFVTLNCIGIFFYRMYKVSEIVEENRRRKGQVYINFYPAALAHYSLTYLMSLLTVLATLQFIRLFSFSRRVHLSVHVLRNSARMLFAFCFILFCFIVGLVIVAIMTFGAVYEGFHNVTYTVVNIISIAMSEFSFQELQEAAPIKGPLFYMFLVISLFFLVVPIFITIIDNSISMTRRINYYLHNELDLLEYLWHYVIDRANPGILTKAGRVIKRMWFDE